MSQDMQAEVRSGIEGLDSLRGEWQGLLAELPAAPFYLLFEWHRAFLLHMAPAPAEVHFVVLRRDGACRGILCLSPGTHARFGVSVRSLCSPCGSEIDLSDCLLGVGEALESWWPCVRKALKRAHVPWDLMKFPRTPGDGLATMQSTGLGSCRLFREQGRTCYLDCSQGYEALSTRYSTRLKKILKKSCKQLKASGEVAMRAVDTPAERDLAFAEFLRLEATGWKAAKGTSLDRARQAGAFHRELFTGEAASPNAEINLLTIDGNAVAAQLCMVSGGTRNLLKIAHDQALEKSSPGSVLLDALLARTGQQRNAAKVSFVTGYPWMDEWGAQSVPTGDLWLFRSATAGSLAGLLLRLKENRLKRLP